MQTVCQFQTEQGNFDFSEHRAVIEQQLLTAKDLAESGDLDNIDPNAAAYLTMINATTITDFMDQYGNYT